MNRTAFDRGWGRTSPAYEHIISWCRRNGVPIIGLNAPDTITHKLSRNQPLTAEEKQIVPNYPRAARSFRAISGQRWPDIKRGGLHHYFEASERGTRPWLDGSLPGSRIIAALWSCSSAAFTQMPGQRSPGALRAALPPDRSFFTGIKPCAARRGLLFPSRLGRLLGADKRRVESRGWRFSESRSRIAGRGKARRLARNAGRPSPPEG